MSDGSTRSAPEGFLTIAQARQRLGVARATMAKMLRASGVDVFEDPRDARVKLLRVEDVDRMAHPRPIQGTDQGKAAA